VVFAVTTLFSAQITSWFIDSSYPAHDLAVKGLPLFASGFVCFGINIVSIGYFQSVERDRPAMAITLLRGFILILFCFWLMPILWGVPGIWLAVPVSELLTFLFVITIYCRRKRS
jgi:Na+-driven multidrug efflux pump